MTLLNKKMQLSFVNINFFILAIRFFFKEKVIIEAASNNDIISELLVRVRIWI